MHSLLRHGAWMDTWGGCETGYTKARVGLTIPTRNAIRIVPADPARPVTPQQKRFNSSVRQIEQARQGLVAWQDNIALFAQAHAQLQVPMLQGLQALRRRWAFALDAAPARKGWTRDQRQTLQALACDSAGELLHTDGDDAQLRALFAKHADVDRTATPAWHVAAYFACALCASM